MGAPRTAQSPGDGVGDPVNDLMPGRGWRELAKQVALISCAIFLYFFVRGLTEGSDAKAIANGHDILAFEERLGIAVERGFQEHVADSHTLATLSNWVYIWLHWPVIVATLLWLHRRHRLDYLLLRNAMFISGAIGLAVFALYPVAPPRLLGAGFVDTVTDRSTSYRILQPPGLINEFAAMPSLHVGWNLLVGVALWRVSTWRPLRAAAVIGPSLMAIAVVATANHYLLDAVVGSALSLFGFAGALAITPWLATRSDRADEREVVQDDPVDPQPL